MSKSAIDLLQEEFGTTFEVHENPVTASVGITSVQFLQASGNRLAFVVINLSANVVYIRPKLDATTSIGIRLDPSGGWRSCYYKEDFLLPTMDWFAIATGAASTIYVLEVRTD